MEHKRWTREEEIIVFNLYCQIPFQRSSKNHPDVIRIANIIGRTPSAVNMKIGNFGSFDNNLKEQGISGLTNASKLDKEIWEEFNSSWDKLSYESEKLLSKLQGNNIEDTISVEDVPVGKTRTAIVKQRVNQAFFRKAVLVSYNSSCCMTGLCNSQLLIASHIKPWKDSTENEKTNPCNGLCLNSLHDKAFDKGFITITTDYKIHISQDIKDTVQNESVYAYFSKYEGRKIQMPEKFMPQKEFLEYHNDVIFEGWK